MEQELFVSELLKLFSASKDNVNIEMKVVDQKEFDLLDKQTDSVVPVNKGNVTYKNETEEKLTVFNYEKFIQSLPEQTRKGIKSCDFMVFNNNSFLCNELSFGNEKSKWPKAWKQMQESIKKINQCVEVKKWLDSVSCKVCVFSTRNNAFTSPFAIADAFNYPQKLLEVVQERNWYPINQLGYKVFEADNIIYKKNGEMEFKQTSA